MHCCSAIAGTGVPASGATREKRDVPEAFRVTEKKNVWVTGWFGQDNNAPRISFNPCVMNGHVTSVSRKKQTKNEPVRRKDTII